MMGSVGVKALPARLREATRLAILLALFSIEERKQFDKLSETERTPFGAGSNRPEEHPNAAENTQDYYLEKMSA